MLQPGAVLVRQGYVKLKVNKVNVCLARSLLIVGDNAVPYINLV